MLMVNIKCSFNHNSFVIELTQLISIRKVMFCKKVLIA